MIQKTHKKSVLHFFPSESHLTLGVCSISSYRDIIVIILCTFPCYSQMCLSCPPILLKKPALPPKCPSLNLDQIIYFSAWEFLTICSMPDDVWGYFGSSKSNSVLIFCALISPRTLSLHSSGAKQQDKNSLNTVMLWRVLQWWGFRQFHSSKLYFNPF